MLCILILSCSEKTGDSRIVLLRCSKRIFLQIDCCNLHWVMICSYLEDLIARWPEASRHPSNLDTASRHILKTHLDMLRTEARRLHSQIVPPGCRASDVNAASSEIDASLKWIRGSSFLVEESSQFARCITRIHSHSPPAARRESSNLRLGLGSPGYTGCLSVPNSTIRWDVLLHPITGVIGAMLQRSLHMLALPGARLPAGSSIPGMKDIGVIARGGPSYGSTALVWRKSVMGQAVAEIPELGSNRRLPISVRCEDGSRLWIIVVYLPPLQSTTREEEWMAEADGLETDIVAMKEWNGPAGPFKLVVLGDINIEPTEIGGADPESRKRRARWTALLERAYLSLLNPTSGSSSPSDVWLPLRQKMAKVGHGCTHHCAGKPRALDIAACSREVAGHMAIHNGLHCKDQLDCKWHQCVEYTTGDHFLSEIEIQEIAMTSLEPGSFRMPSWWNNLDRWEAGLKESAQLLQHFRSILACLRACYAPALGGARAKPQEASWLGDTCALIFSVIHTIIMWGWVLPAGASKSGKKRRHEYASADSPDQSAKWLRTLKEKADAGEAPQALLTWVFQLLKPTQPQPPMFLAKQRTQVTAQESHAIWCKQIEKQSAWTAPYDEAFDEHVRAEVKQRLSRARSHTGFGPHDYPISSDECRRAYKAWDTTTATTPDLIPRCVFSTSLGVWHQVVWNLMDLAGPACLAVRPMAWRGAASVPLYKKGLPEEATSYRLIMVKSQLGLLQEDLVHARLSSQVKGSITAGQSGYIRDVGDAHLLLHECMAEAIAVHKPIWAVFGDLQKAFPRTWREAMLLELATTARVQDGILSVLGSMMEQDHIYVFISGGSVVTMRQGVAEGGLLGPLAFPSYMDTLVQALVAGDCGVGLGIKVPDEWSQHQWVGNGAPDAQIVEQLLGAINRGSALPSSTQLAASSRLEASALRVLDKLANIRLAAVLHADDPVLLASSYGEAEEVQGILAQWAFRFKATPHVSTSKSVVMTAGPLGYLHEVSAMPPLMVKLAGQAPSALTHVISHKWLGLLWNMDLDLDVALHNVIREATAKFISVASLASSNMLPLPYVLSIFETVIEGKMRFGRWLYATSQQAAKTLDSLYVKWARELLGAKPWHSARKVTCEIGWNMTGSGRAVVDIASKRCSLHLLPQDDLYRRVFIQSHNVAGRTWSKISKSKLDEWGILDWPEWKHQGSTRLQYRDYAREIVIKRCAVQIYQELDRSLEPCNIAAIRGKASEDMRQAIKTALSWETALLLRSLSRLRANILRFGHLDNKQSRASRQRCIFCDTITHSLVFHVMCRCTVWQQQRELFWRTCQVGKPEQLADQVKAMFCSQPKDLSFTAMLHWAGNLDRQEGQFWQNVS